MIRPSRIVESFELGREQIAFTVATLSNNGQREVSEGKCQTSDLPSEIAASTAIGLPAMQTRTGLTPEHVRRLGANADRCGSDRATQRDEFSRSQSLVRRLSEQRGLRPNCWTEKSPSGQDRRQSESRYATQPSQNPSDIRQQCLVVSEEHDDTCKDR